MVILVGMGTYNVKRILIGLDNSKNILFSETYNHLVLLKSMLKLDNHNMFELLGDNT